MISTTQTSNSRSKWRFGFLAGVLLATTLIVSSSVWGEVITFNDSWSERGFNLINQDAFGVEVIFSIERMAFEDLFVDGRLMQTPLLPGVILPNNPGAPNLPGSGRYIAIPQGATAKVQIIDCRTEIYQDMEIAPAAPIPYEWDDSPPVYRRDGNIYNLDAYYPESPVRLSEPSKIRGVDVVILGITPFQYNPVTKELVVYRDLKIQVDFIGGNGHFGEDRLRSRYWDPILKGNVLNYQTLPEVDYNRVPISDEDNVEYLIIIPDDPSFAAWADSIKAWRSLQGIITGVTPLSELGGNNSTAIENYINDAYYNWDIPPVAVLLLSDYQNSGDLYGITSPYYSGSASDNKYADIDNDNLPDLTIARICAQDGHDLETMIGKLLDYERNPPTDPGFYDHPIIAGGWQTPRWFILCCEVIWGFLDIVHDQDPVREYAIYSGTPGTIWSSNSNTWMIVDYFGPNGLGYIPIDPSYLWDWGGNAARLNRDINQGAWMLMHRDHGSIDGWGEPDYDIDDLNGLFNDMYPFVLSINCLTGKFTHSSWCFAEAFHRPEHRALGVIAASGISYSFVNDTYVWGMWDSMFPEFDPGYGADLTGSTNLQPAFANSYGKYYLSVSNWPYNPQNKTVTYHLFHHHGDAFTTLFSQVPEELTVSHQDVLLAGASQFAVTANDGAIIGLTVDGEIIGTAEATGAPVPVDIIPQTAGSTMLVTVTLQNHFRYSEEVDVIEATGPYVVFNSVEINDESGNNNGLVNGGEDVLLSITVENIGVATATDVDVTISTDDIYTTILDDYEYYGDIPEGTTAVVTDGFEIEVADNCPDWQNIGFELTATSGDTVWVSNFSILVFPNLSITLEPVNPPIVIPANGGSFDYDVAAVNDGFNTTEFTFWNDVILPNGTLYGPILVRPDLTLAPGETMSRTLTQSVPPNAPSGTYTYQVHIGDYPSNVVAETSFDFEKSAVDFSLNGGSSDWTVTGWDEEVVLSGGDMPTEFSLSQNYPNPFNPETIISFELRDACFVELIVYDIQGREVARLADGYYSAGMHDFTFDGSDLSSGVYLAWLQADGFQQARKLLLLK